MNDSIRMTLGRMTLAMVVCLGLAGCSEQESASSKESKLATSSSQEQEKGKQKQEQGKAEGGKSEQSGSVLPPVDIDQETLRSEIPNKAAATDRRTSSEERTSRLDEAITKLNEQEPIDIHESKARFEEEVPDAEVHESLKPLVQDHWIRLHPGYEVWLDTKGKQVFVGGRISIHEGMLEMFACPIQTKDHESIIATISNAKIIHAGLLASGAIAGRPTRWMPEFIPAFGPKCEMHILWNDDDGQHEVRAQDMILDLDTGKPLDSDWVFCGSKVWVNPDNSEDQEYFADHGELISVSNFPSSMIDLNIESSNANTGLRFQANKDKIPSPGTAVIIRIKPDLTTNPTEKQLEQADIEIAKAEKQLQEEYEQARKERKARMKKQREEEETREAELQAERDNRKSK